IDKSDYIIKGVLDKVPEHFHLALDYVLPLASVHIRAERMKSWQWQQFFTYMKVKPGTNIGQFQDKMQAGIKKEGASATAQSGFTIVPFLQPLKDIHLRSSDFIYDNAKRGNAHYVK